MLLVTSNWAVSDGSLAASGEGRAASWLRAIRWAIVRAGSCRDGRYRPIREATLVFAGDTFDWLLSDAWAGGDRPWRGDRGAAAVRAGVAAATFRMARPAWRLLVGWARRGLVVPAADGHGRPSAWASTTVGLRVVMLAGDRDRWLPELAATGSRILVGEEWTDGHLGIRHGHDLDPLTHDSAAIPTQHDRPPTLGESLAVDLLVPFAVSARANPGLWPTVRRNLDHLAAARPSTLPGLVADLVAGGGDGVGPGRVRLLLHDLWRSHVDRWQRVARRDAAACEAEFDVLEDLAAWLGRLEPAGACPPALRRFDLPAGSPCGGRVMVAHPAASTGPMLFCRLAERTWYEPLAAPPPEPGVVTVGGDDGGSRFVDAA